MNTREAIEIGERVAELVASDRTHQAYALLAPFLARRTPFPFLSRIGAIVGAQPLDPVNHFLELVAANRTEGGWVVIGSALGAQLERDWAGAFARCRGYVLAADLWYATDILGERVVGPALLLDLERGLAEIKPWREDPSRWVRRTVGVAVHFWAKRSRGKPGTAPQALALLSLLEPMFSEWDMDAVKGIGWGLKTLGRYYPALVSEWLGEQVVKRQRRYRTLMVRKALTYLPNNERARAIGEAA